jgi:hypothetical protein
VDRRRSRGDGVRRPHELPGAAERADHGPLGKAPLLHLRPDVPERLRLAARAARRAQAAPGILAGKRSRDAQVERPHPGLGGGVLPAGVQAQARRHHLQACAVDLSVRALPRLAQGEMQHAAGNGDRRLHRSGRHSHGLRRAATRGLRAGREVEVFRQSGDRLQRGDLEIDAQAAEGARDPGTAFQQPAARLRSQRRALDQARARRRDRIHRVDQRRDTPPSFVPGIAGGQESERRSAGTCGGDRGSGESAARAERAQPQDGVDRGRGENPQTQCEGIAAGFSG